MTRDIQDTNEKDSAPPEELASSLSRYNMQDRKS